MEKFPPEESAGETEESVWKGIFKRIDTGAAFLELETIEKGLQVLGSGVAKVSEHICPPSITIASGQVTPGDLFKNVRYMDGFNGRYVRHILEIPGSHVLQEGWKRK